MRLAAAALPILAIACGGTTGGAADPRAAELACQQRLVAVLQGQPPGREMAVNFEGVGARFAAVAPEGCNESQRRTAEIMARLSRRIAVTLRETRGNPLERQPSPETDRQLLELQSSIEEFEHRRRRLIEGLRQMETQER